MRLHLLWVNWYANEPKCKQWRHDEYAYTFTSPCTAGLVARLQKKSHDFVRFTVERKVLPGGGGEIEIAEKKVYNSVGKYTLNWTKPKEHVKIRNLAIHFLLMYYLHLNLCTYFILSKHATIIFALQLLSMR